MFNLNFLKFPMFTIKFFDFDIKIPWFHNKNLWFWQNLTCFERRLINNLGSSNSCIVPYSIWIILWSLDVKVRDMSFLSSNVDSINETSWLLWFFFKKKNPSKFLVKDSKSLRKLSVTNLFEKNSKN
jgi:hypothetical protein